MGEPEQGCTVENGHTLACWGVSFPCMGCSRHNAPWYRVPLPLHSMDAVAKWVLYTLSPTNVPLSVFCSECCSKGNGNGANASAASMDAAYKHEEDAIVSILQPLKTFGYVALACVCGGVGAVAVCTSSTSLRGWFFWGMWPLAPLVAELAPMISIDRI
jgi:hypothetical protein